MDPFILFKISTKLAVRGCLLSTFLIKTKSAVRESLHSPLKILFSDSGQGKLKIFSVFLAVHGSLLLALKLRTESADSGSLHTYFQI